MTQAPLTALLILDGWGIHPETDNNAVALAATPFLDHLQNSYPQTELRCSGGDVGLPDGIMGNSEVGHLNIGAGRIVYQDLLRIDMDIESGRFFENTTLRRIMERVRSKQSALHLMGLVSDGGVHSQLGHLYALIRMAKANGVPCVHVHAILDGRDTPPQSGVSYLRQLQSRLQAEAFGDIASVCGRYYAMDRDKRWDRTEMAYRLYTSGEGRTESDPVQAVMAAYERNETDEFVRPIAIAGGGTPDWMVSDGDGILFFNFRADRARQITRAFTDSGFSEFKRTAAPNLCQFVCMTQYDETFDLPVAFPPVHLENILGEVLSRHGLPQLRIAETEKYAHVTYFFNGGEERAFPLEDRCLIPSPRDVPTYDHKPEMSAFEVTEEAVQRINTGRYQVMVLNFANMDMVGHTGILKAAIRACETVDACVEKIVTEILRRDGVVMVTADHGNAEKMVDASGNPHTAHTVHRVPFILVDGRRSSGRSSGSLRPGILADIAPTILDVLGLEQPEEMTGRSLLA